MKDIWKQIDSKSNSRPILIFDKENTNANKIFKAIDEIIFSNNSYESAFLGRLLLDSQEILKREEEYFLRGDELRNDEHEIYSLRDYIRSISFKEEINKIWKFEGPDFLIQTNEKYIGLEILSAQTDSYYRELDKNKNDGSEEYNRYKDIKIRGVSEAKHSTYEHITSNNIKAIERHFKKYEKYKVNIEKIIKEKYEVNILIDLGGAERIAEYEEEAIRDIFKLAYENNIEPKYIFIKIGVTNKTLNELKNNWFSLDEFSDFNEWIN